MRGPMATRERMRTLSDIPLPPPAPAPRPEGSPVPRSDVAPRTTHTSVSLPSDPRVAQFETTEADVPFPPGAFSPDDAIDEQIADLERWAVANEKREQIESIRFWTLRGTAFTSAVAAAVCGAFEANKAS